MENGLPPGSEYLPNKSLLVNSNHRLIYINYSKLTCKFE